MRRRGRSACDGGLDARGYYDGGGGGEYCDGGEKRRKNARVYAYAYEYDSDDVAEKRYNLHPRSPKSHMHLPSASPPLHNSSRARTIHLQPS